MGPVSSCTRIARPWMSGNDSGSPIARENRTVASRRPGTPSGIPSSAGRECRLIDALTTEPRGCSGLAPRTTPIATATPPSSTPPAAAATAAAP